MFDLIVTLTVVGAVLVFVEIFVPGAVAGIVGGLALFAAVALVYAEYGMGRGNLMLIAVLVFGAGLLVWWMRSFSHSRLGRKWTLQSAVPNDPLQSSFHHFVDREGNAVTDLRPAGKALIDGTRVDVIAESDQIDRGAAIRVVRVEGTKVVVRRA